MSEETLKIILISLIPSLLVYLAERGKQKLDKDSKSTDSIFVAYDKQLIWIEKLEKELEERDNVIKDLEERIKELEENGRND
ncbi:hypothetical protein ACWOBX_08395 [Facklamia languida]